MFLLFYSLSKLYFLYLWACTLYIYSFLLSDHLLSLEICRFLVCYFLNVCFFYFDLLNYCFFKDVRLKFSLSLMMIVIFTVVGTSLLRLQDDSFKQNMFEHMTKNYRNTLEFCLMFTLFNFYVYILAFTYSPAKGALYGM
jgi:hypothetical protein